MSARPRILLVAQRINATGYGRVVKSLLPHLCQEFDVHHFALNDRPRCSSSCIRDDCTTRESDGDELWTTHRNLLPGDIHGVVQVPQLVARLRPGIVWVVHDLYLPVLLAPGLAAGAAAPKLIAYCPIDGDAPRAERLSACRLLHRLVVFTESARRGVEDAFADIRMKEPAFRTPGVEVIPHGVDTRTFAPCEPPAADADRYHAARLQARAILWPGRPDLAGAFVVLNGNRNSVRKRIDLTLRGFARFSRDKPPDVLMYLHMGMQDRGADLERLIDELQLRSRILRTTEDAAKPYVSDTRLNLIYNACDVGVNTASAEAWGLVALEHAATGAAQVMPGHKTCREIWGEAAVLLPTGAPFTNPFDFIDHALVSADDVADGLEGLYARPPWRREMSELAFARARSPEFEWKTIAAAWSRTFAETL